MTRKAKNIATIVDQLEAVRAEMAALDELETVDAHQDVRYQELLDAEHDLECDLKAARAPRNRAPAETQALVFENID